MTDEHEPIRPPDRSHTSVTAALMIAAAIAQIANSLVEPAFWRNCLLLLAIALVIGAVILAVKFDKWAEAWREWGIGERGRTRAALDNQAAILAAQSEKAASLEDSILLAKKEMSKRLPGLHQEITNARMESLGATRDLISAIQWGQARSSFGEYKHFTLTALLQERSAFILRLLLWALHADRPNVAKKVQEAVANFDARAAHRIPKYCAVVFDDKEREEAIRELCSVYELWKEVCPFITPPPPAGSAAP